MRRGLRSRATCVVLATAAMSMATDAAAQTETDTQLEVRRLAATPIGALPPTAMPMPASRNHNYWGARLHIGRGSHRAHQFALGGGIDLQWRGGSVFGVTGGYQFADCAPSDADCGGHALFGARARLNVVTGGPTAGALIGDESATTTLGTEVGFGYAPRAMREVDVCTLDTAVPLSVAMLQSVRLVISVAPGLVWDLGCTAGSRPTRASYFMGLGLGVQQLGSRGLDLHVGVQRIFRRDLRPQFGVSLAYIRLP